MHAVSELTHNVQLLPLFLGFALLIGLAIVVWYLLGFHHEMGQGSLHCRRVLRAFQAVAAKVPMMMSLVDCQGHVLYINPNGLGL